MKRIIIVPLIILVSLFFIQPICAQDNPDDQILPNGTYYMSAPVNKQRLFSLSTKGNVKMKDASNNEDEQWIFTHIKDNIYTIQNKKTSGYLEVPFAACEDSKSVQTWDTGAEPHQRWEVGIKFKQFVLKPSHCLAKALDRSFGAADADATIFEFENGDNINLHWDITNINLPGTGTILMHPNPARNTIQIEGLSLNPTPVKVVDRLGRIVFTTTLDRKNNKLNINSIQSGLYLLILESGAGKSFVKL